MNERAKEIADNIMKMDDYERYRFFVERIVDTEEVWVLAEEDGYLSMELDNGKSFTPVWAVKEMAEANNKNLLAGSEAMTLDLPFFMSDILERAIKNKDIVAPNFDFDTDDYDSFGLRIMKRAINSEIKAKNTWYRKHEDNDVDRWDSPPPYKELLEGMRRSFEKNREREDYSFAPPWWITRDDPLRTYFEDTGPLNKEGKVCYGYIWKCDEGLFDKYPREDRPALVIYGEDPAFEEDPDRLREIGERLDELASSDIIPGDLKAILTETRSEDPRIIDTVIPPGIFSQEVLASGTGGTGTVRLTTLVVHKAHLPERMLFRRIIPIVTGPASSPHAAILPESCWHSQFRKYYMGFSEVDISHKKEPKQDEEVIRGNDRILNMNDKEKYDYFVKEVCRNEVVWTLEEDGSPAGLTDENGRDTFLFWPTEELATMNRTGYYKNFWPKPVSAYEFIAKWLPMIKKHDDEVMLFFYRKDGLDADVLKLRDDLEREILRDG